MIVLVIANRKSHGQIENQRRKKSLCGRLCMKIKRQTKSIMKYNQGQRLLSSATYPEISLREPRITSKPGSYSRANTEDKR